MAINIFELQPNKVNCNLLGYSFLFYGDPKTGKTTIASKFPKALLLAFEKGYAAIPGIIAQPINSWSEFKKVLKQLKEEKAKELFETIILDTGDIAYDYDIKYICDNAKRPDGGYGVDSIGDIPFGKGYALAEKEFDECLRSIVQMGYGLVIISHAVDKTITDADGTEYSRIMPTMDKRAVKIVSRMTDVIGYARPITQEDGTVSTKLFMRGNTRFMAGSRFKYTPDVIDFNYESLVNAIRDAIDKQAAEDGAELFSDGATKNIFEDTTKELNFDDLMAEFNSIVQKLIEENDEQTFITQWQPKLTEIIEKYLGKGNKVNNCTRTQVEAISLIVEDLRELVKNK